MHVATLPCEIKYSKFALLAAIESRQQQIGLNVHWRECGRGR